MNKKPLPFYKQKVRTDVGLVASIFVISAVLSATAQATTIVDFSFSNGFGNVSGTVSGKLYGLADTGTSAATSIIITSAPAGVGFSSLPIDITTLGWANINNSITITSGIVTDSSILYANGYGSDAQQFLLNYGGINQLNNINGQHGVVNVDGFNAITFNVEGAASNVPEPATLELMGLGLAWMVFRRKVAG